MEDDEESWRIASEAFHWFDNINKSSDSTPVLDRYLRTTPKPGMRYKTQAMKERFPELTNDQFEKAVQLIYASRRKKARLAKRGLANALAAAQQEDTDNSDGSPSPKRSHQVHAGNRNESPVFHQEAEAWPDMANRASSAAPSNQAASSSSASETGGYDDISGSQVLTDFERRKLAEHFCWCVNRDGKRITRTNVEDLVIYLLRFRQKAAPSTLNALETKAMEQRYVPRSVVSYILAEVESIMEAQDSRSTNVSNLDRIETSQEEMFEIQVPSPPKFDIDLTQIDQTAASSDADSTASRIQLVAQSLIAYSDDLARWTDAVTATLTKENGRMVQCARLTETLLKVLQLEQESGTSDTRATSQEDYTRPGIVGARRLATDTDDSELILELTGQHGEENCPSEKYGRSRSSVWRPGPDLCQ